MEHGIVTVKEGGLLTKVQLPHPHVSQIIPQKKRGERLQCHKRLSSCHFLRPKTKTAKKKAEKNNPRVTRAQV